MELSWSTFLLEIMNFLVLVWILKRFLYRPVLDIIEKRRSSIEQVLAEANKRNTDAEVLQQQYEGRLVDWEQEKQKITDSLQQEIQAERVKLLDQLSVELADERKKTIVVEQRHQAELQQQYQEEAMIHGARFASKLLHAVASPELEKQLFELLINELSQLQDERIETLRKTKLKSVDKIKVSSAFKLSNTQHQQLEKILRKFYDQSIPVEYEQDTKLLAGLRISLGSWVLRMNLADELSSFAALSHE